MAVLPREEGQADLSTPANALGTLVDLCMAMPRSLWLHPRQSSAAVQPGRRHHGACNLARDLDIISLQLRIVLWVRSMIKTRSGRTLQSRM